MARRLPRRASLDELANDFGKLQLATLVEEVPTGDTWSYELKYDGYRILALKSGDDVRLVSRTGQDWTEPFREVAGEVATRSSRVCVLDGEVCALDEEGRPSFQRLQNRDAGRRLAYFVFDLLYDDGEDVRARPIEERRARLARLVGVNAPGRLVVLSAVVHGRGSDTLRAACAAGLEGVVAKQLGLPYAPGRSKSWLKIKCTKRQEMVVIGWMPLANSTRAVGSLLLATMGPDGRFHFSGKVGTGFDDKTRLSLAALLERDATKHAAANDVPRLGGLPRFVKPRHVVEVAFAEWTDGGHIRHPSFKGVRKDKRPEECVREVPISGDDLRARVTAKSSASPKSTKSPSTRGWHAKC